MPDRSLFKYRFVCGTCSHKWIGEELLPRAGLLPILCLECKSEAEFCFDPKLSEEEVNEAVGILKEAASV